MKVTVTFGDTSVVVPCKAGWTVRDLIEQATRRYRRILEQVSAVFALLHAILHEYRTNMTQRFIPVILRILWGVALITWAGCGSRDTANLQVMTSSLSELTLAASLNKTEKKAIYCLQTINFAAKIEPNSLYGTYLCQASQSVVES